MKAKLLLVILISLFAVTISAQNKPYIKQKIQKAKIYSGIKNGELTKSEVKHLKVHKLKINKIKKRAIADGCITKRERQKIYFANAHLNKDIFVFKHNKSKRF